MKKVGDLELKSINGYSPEEYTAKQTAAENKVRKKNRKEHLYYAVFVGVIALLATTTLEYVLVGTITVCGWVWLWFSQNIPFGPDDGMPRTHGWPPVFGVGLHMFPIATIGALGMLIYLLLI